MLKDANLVDLLRALVQSAVVIFIMSGCASHDHIWYKPGHYQGDYDVDCVECERVAKTLSMERSVSGRSLNNEVYAKAFDRCMFSKGWTTNAPDTNKNPKQKKAETGPNFFTVSGGIISGFDCSIALPPGFRLLKQESFAYGPTQTSSALFQGPDSVFINILFQDSGSLSFEKQRYPVKEPYFSFDKSTKEDAIDWTSFFGQVGSDWVGGIGAYLNLSSRQRIILVATRPLPRDRAVPPKGLRLDRKQFETMKYFSEDYAGWIEGLGAQAIQSDWKKLF
ncbi:hypothetical protein [Desulfoplanes sp.]